MSNYQNKMLEVEGTLKIDLGKVKASFFLIRIITDTRNLSLISSTKLTVAVVANFLSVST
jgi:hypothetical protein